MELNSGRSRAPNFTEEEQILLREVLEPYMRIIESKKTDCVRQAQKQEAWTKVTQIYNANTKYVSRSMESLISCYRNMKTKLKKQYSDTSMVLRDTNQEEESLGTTESHSNDGGQKPPQVCEIFLDLNKELRNNESLHKKNMASGTFGIPLTEDEAHVAQKKNKHVDGEFEVLVTPSESEIHATSLLKCKPITQLKPTINRTDPRNKSSLLSPALICNDKAEEPPLKKRRNFHATFIDLSQQKLELVKLQKRSAEMDIEHKKRVHELELENLIKQNNHQEEMRQKELMLMDLKIEAASNGKF